jgi:hypothetical protein
MEAAITQSNGGIPFEVGGFFQWNQDPNIFAVKDKDGRFHENRVWCAKCNNEEGAVIASSGGASNIISHLMTHGIFVKQKPELQQSGKEWHGKFKSPESRARLLLYWVIKKAIPFSTVNDEVFRFMTGTSMARQSVPKHIKKAARAIEARIKEILAGCEWIALCFDEWQSGSHQDFMALNLQASDGRQTYTFCIGHVHIQAEHATSTVLGSIIKHKLEQYGVWGRISCVVSDNASVCIKAVADLGLDRSACTAHVMNLMLSTFINEYKEELQPIITLAAKSRHSGTFRKICENYKKTNKEASGKVELTTFSSGRWYSMSGLLHNAIDLEAQVFLYSDALSDRSHRKCKKDPHRREMSKLVHEAKAPPADSDDVSWTDAITNEGVAFGLGIDDEELPERRQLLAAFEVAKNILPVIDSSAAHTGTLESEGFGSITNVLLAKTWLDESVAEMAQKTKSTRPTEAWKRAQAKHWDVLLSQDMIDRFARAVFFRRSVPARFVLGPDLYERTKTQIEKEVAEMERKQGEKNGAANPSFQIGSESGINTQTLGALRRRAALAGGNAVKGEVSRFMEMSASEADDDDILRWWDPRREELPCLFRLMMQSCIVPATSAASERQFSKAKRLVTDARRSLAPDTLEALVFCRENLAMMADYFSIDAEMFAE